MKRRTLTFLLLLFVSIGSYAQQPAWTMDSIIKQGPEYDMIRPLAGNWLVIQTLYGRDAVSVQSRDTFAVTRKMVGNFFEETIRPRTVGKSPDFTRVSYLNYNRTNARWEYIVLDSRFPIMMFETSRETGKVSDRRVDVYLDAFPCPPFFGPSYTGLIVKEHRVIRFESDRETVHQQFWTLPGGKEFLAIQYDFIRR